MTWKRTRVDRVATVNARIGWKALTAVEYQLEGYTFLSTPNIKSESIDFDNVNYISEYRYQESPELKLQPGDVLLAKDGNTLGITNIVRELPKPATVNGSIAVLRAFDIEPRFLRYSLASTATQDLIDSIKGGMGVPHLFQWDIKRLPVALPPLDEQRRIADFLDAETGRVDQLMANQLQLLELLEERANSRILELIGQSTIVSPEGSGVVPLRRVITKLNQPVRPTDEVITAFRDGQVTARSRRRSEGYTMSASSEPQGQGVDVGDIVIHGLDGFAGAIGDSEASGNCTPVYHVCQPIDGGNSAFYGRLLRLLAIGDYLALFGVSARERAVDFRNWKIFGHAPVPVVSREKQHEIGGLITKIRPLREEVKRFNERLTERKQALITAVVTGEIDVTTAGRTAEAITG
jgi:type I restriction enzyme, S subunit